ncbi:lipopolysaccharide biosynthesis protein [Nocardioides bruguierae]|uniref:lipopolysaccharide biosynthesis protein n=1 Tax=Nocardioides bruguierae TaxID=2945102 RepID=UPI0020224644|nr:hypothetical protein [Nocardioides bruguierae]MCL8026151.1 hypothetical protein [Nocardioides bruguierae]
MTATEQASGSAPSLGRLVGRAGSSVVGPASSLMAATVTTSLLGLVFWAVAARTYDTAEVGRASAVISAATLLATLAQLNLGNVFGRFLPAARERQRAFVGRGTGVVVGLALALGAVYALLPVSDPLLEGVAEGVTFPLLVAVLAVFALQDLVLVAVGRATWVPVENLFFALAKLGLLVAVAPLVPRGGIALAWVLPALLAVLVVSAGLLPGVVLGRPGRGPVGGVLPTPRTLRESVAGEYLTGLVSTAVPFALPLLVVHRLGLEANAWFSLPWMAATALNLLLWNIASAMLVRGAERAHASGGSTATAVTGHLTRSSLQLALAVATSGALALWLGGDLLLSLVGAEYVEQSRWMLRLAATAAPATAVIVVWTTRARLQHRMVAMVVVQSLLGGATLGGAALLLGPLGITGVGVAYLGTQAVAGALLLPGVLRACRDDQDSRGEQDGEPV